MQRLNHIMTTRPSAWRWTAAIVLSMAAAQWMLPVTISGHSTTQQVAEINNLAPNLLSDNDSALYKSIFTAQDAGNHAVADIAIGQLANTRLVGQVLAQRYLDSNYNASAAELGEWLAKYSDHPQAPRIARLAMRRGLDVNIAAADEPLKGDGYTDHMGRNTMPDNWYRGLSLWRDKDYSAAEPIFAAVGENEALGDWQRSAGYYWAYRAAQRAEDSHAARINLTQAAHYNTTFYGLLAAQQTGMPTVKAEAPEVSDHLRDDARVIRAELLASLGRSEDAEDELRHLYSALSKNQRPAIVTLASEMGLANLQVRLARMPQLSNAQAMFAQYPMPQFMVDAQNIMDPALLLAIARNESSFREDVTSGGGAVGMMQMLPSTARAVERHVGVALASASDDTLPMAERLSDPALSIRYGAHYLKLLTQEPAIGHNLLRLLAGYNAGPGAVAGWQSMARTMDDPLLYIESIPYSETHNYVLQVMAQYWVYQQLLGEDASTLSTIAQGKWPTV